MIYGCNIENNPPFSIGAFIEDDFASMRFNPLFIDIILNWENGETPFGVLVAFRVPFFIGIAFFMKNITEEQFREQINEQINSNNEKR